MSKTMRNSECGVRSADSFYREDAKIAKKSLDSDLRSFQKPSPPLRLGGSSIFVLVCILSSVVCLLSSASPVFAVSGRDVYEKVHEVGKKMLNRTTHVTMVLYDKGGGKRTRTLMEYSKRTGDEAYKTLILFKTPADLKDVGFLIHARSFSDRDLWAYFPEFKRIRRIPNTSQDDSFFGSDFSYDDFGGPPKLDEYKFDILKEESVDGMPCYVVEVVPKVRRKFTRYVAWVAKDQWVHLKIDYYQDRELYRSGSFRDIRVVDNVPTSLHMEMENKKTGHRTELTIDEIKYNVNHPDSLFTQRALERAGK